MDFSCLLGPMCVIFLFLSFFDVSIAASIPSARKLKRTRNSLNTETITKYSEDTNDKQNILLNTEFIDNTKGNEFVKKKKRTKISTKKSQKQNTKTKTNTIENLGTKGVKDEKREGKLTIVENQDTPQRSLGELQAQETKSISEQTANQKPQMSAVEKAIPSVTKPVRDDTKKQSTKTKKRRRLRNRKKSKSSKKKSRLSRKSHNKDIEKSGQSKKDNKDKVMKSPKSKKDSKGEIMMKSPQSKTNNKDQIMKSPQLTAMKTQSKREKTTNSKDVPKRSIDSIQSSKTTQSNITKDTTTENAKDIRNNSLEQSTMSVSTAVSKSTSKTSKVLGTKHNDTTFSDTTIPVKETLADNSTHISSDRTTETDSKSISISSTVSTTATGTTTATIPESTQPTETLTPVYAIDDSNVSSLLGTLTSILADIKDLGVFNYTSEDSNALDELINATVSSLESNSTINHDTNPNSNLPGLPPVTQSSERSSIMINQKKPRSFFWSGDSSEEDFVQAKKAPSFIKETKNRLFSSYEDDFSDEELPELHNDPNVHNTEPNKKNKAAVEKVHSKELNNKNKAEVEKNIQSTESSDYYSDEYEDYEDSSDTKHNNEQDTSYEDEDYEDSSDTKHNNEQDTSFEDEYYSDEVSDSDENDNGRIKGLMFLSPLQKGKADNKNPQSNTNTNNDELYDYESESESDYSDYSDSNDNNDFDDFEKFDDFDDEYSDEWEDMSDETAEVQNRKDTNSPGGTRFKEWMTNQQNKVHKKTLKHIPHHFHRTYMALTPKQRGQYFRRLQSLGKIPVDKYTNYERLLSSQGKKGQLHKKASGQQDEISTNNMNNNQYSDYSEDSLSDEYYDDDEYSDEYESETSEYENDDGTYSDEYYDDSESEYYDDDEDADNIKNTIHNATDKLPATNVKPIVSGNQFVAKKRKAKDNP